MPDVVPSGGPDAVSFGDVLSLRVELPSCVADSQGGLPRALTLAVEHEAAVLLAELGIPGRLRVELGTAPEGEVVRLTLDGRRARFAADVLVYTYSAATGGLLDAEATPAGITAWLQARCADPTDTVGQARLLEFLTRTCLEILARQPALILGPRQAVAYVASLPAREDGTTSGGRRDPARLQPLLGLLLDMRMSLAARQAVADTLAEAEAGEWSDQMLLEALVEALRRGTVDIHMSPDSLRELTITWEGEGTEAFPFLRDGMFQELGLIVPPLRFVPVEGMKPGTFAIQVNGIASLPLQGLAPHLCLVNDTPDRLRSMGFPAEPTVNPATAQLNGVVPRVATAQANELRLTTWNQLEYIVLTLAEHLREHGWCVLHRAGVARQLDELRNAFPILVDTAAARISIEAITGVLRELLRERVPVRNLRAILETLLDWDATRSASASRDSTAGALQAVRRGLSREIAYRAGYQAPTLVVYLLDARIERLAAADPASALGDRADEIVGAITREVAFLPRGVRMPHLLVSAVARPTLRALIALEFPRMAVIAHEELPPGTNVQPLARILLREDTPVAASPA